MAAARVIIIATMLVPFPQGQNVPTAVHDGAKGSLTILTISES